MKPNRKGEVKASENVLKLFQTSEGSYLSYMIMMAAYRSTYMLMQIICAYICTCMMPVLRRSTTGPIVEAWHF